MKRVALVCVIGILSLLLIQGIAIAQGAKDPEAAPAAAKQSGPKTESIYGEVLALKEDGSSMTVQYYDYDTDEEKNVEISADKNTKFENASALKDVKKGDWVDAAYGVGEAGKNVASSISVEKEEEESPVPVEPKAEETQKK